MDRTSQGDRLNFGRYFKNKVLNGKIPNVSYIGKAENNSALYQKEKEKCNETVDL